MKLVALAGMALAAGVAATGPQLPGAAGCPLSPADNPWNQRVDTLPVASPTLGDFVRHVATRRVRRSSQTGR